MSKLSLSLSSSTLQVISALAKEHDTTLDEMARYLLTKGLAQYSSTKNEIRVLPSTPLRQADLSKAEL